MIGFVGLGNMGGPMAARLVAAGHDVRGFDPQPEARARFAAEAGVEAVASLAGVAEDADVVILMLPGTPVVRAVLGEGGLLAALAPGALVIDMSSSEPTATRELAAQAAGRGVRFVDAPVSGGVAGARAGTLTIMAGGEDADVDAARPILEALGSDVAHVGPVGAGHALKALNNLLSATSMLATSEAMLTARRFGLDPQVVLDVVNRSSGKSWSTELKFPRYVLPEAFDSGFGLGLMLKDARIAVALARETGAPATLGEAVVEAWARAADELPEGADHTEIARWVDARAEGARVSWEVLAVRYGTLASTKAKLHHNWAVYGEPDGPQGLDYFFYVLRDGERVVLVDTGFSVAAGEGRGRTCLVAPREAVARLGIAPEDVTDLVVTHLHYDHIGNLTGWPAARLHVPGAELDFWATEIARGPHFWPHTDPEPLAWIEGEDRAGRVARYAGPAEPVEGVQAIHVGGHSPGQHVLLVRTAGKPVLLASDAVHLYEELEHGRPFAVFADLVEMYEGYALVRRLEAEHGATVVVGHDPLVAQRFAALDPKGTVLRIA